MKKVLFIFLIWLVVINLFALLSLNRFNLQPDNAYSWIDPAKVAQEQNWDLISLHAKWDSFWHLDIAKNGYSYVEGNLSNIVFLPLYATIIKLFSILTLGNMALAGWISSIIFLFLGLLYLYRLVKEFHKDINPHLTIIFLLIFPTSFFLNTIYTESLFLFLSAATFYYTLKKNYLLAGIFGFFAGITRITGFLLFVPVLYEYLKENNFEFKKLFSKKILPIYLIPLGTFLFFLYHKLTFGSYFLFFKVQSLWGRNFDMKGKVLELYNNPAIVNSVLDITYVLFIFVIIYFVFKRIRASYGIYMFLSVLVALSTGTLMSIGRYILVLFPIYILLASIKNETFKQALGFIFILLLALNITSFVNYYWAG